MYGNVFLSNSGTTLNFLFNYIFDFGIKSVSPVIMILSKNHSDTNSSIYTYIFYNQ